VLWASTWSVHVAGGWWGQGPRGGCSWGHRHVVILAGGWGQRTLTWTCTVTCIVTLWVTSSVTLTLNIAWGHCEVILVGHISVTLTLLTITAAGWWCWWPWPLAPGQCVARVHREVIIRGAVLKVLQPVRQHSSFLYIVICTYMFKIWTIYSKFLSLCNRHFFLCTWFYICYSLFHLLLQSVYVVGLKFLLEVQP